MSFASIRGGVGHTNRYASSAMKKLPVTLDHAVERIICALEPDSRRLLLSIPRADLVENDEWALGIRNDLKLWSNNALRLDCGDPSIHPDDATVVVMKAVWNVLNGLPIEDARTPEHTTDWKCMKEVGPEEMYRRLRFKKNGQRHPVENIKRKMDYLFPMTSEELQSLADATEDA